MAFEIFWLIGMVVFISLIIISSIALLIELKKYKKESKIIDAVLKGISNG